MKPHPKPSACSPLAWVLGLLAACSGGGSSDPGGGGGGAAAFSLALQPAVLQVPAGGTSQVTARVTPETGFTSDVVLGVSGLPAEVQGTLAQTTVRSGDVALDVSVTPGTAVGNHVLTLTGRGGGIEQTATLAVEIVDTGFDFALDLDLRAVDVERGGSAASEVQARVVMGQLPAVTWTLEGLPAGLTGGVASGVAPGGSDLLTLAADGTTATGTHEVTVVATADTLRRESRMLVHVLPARDTSGLTVHAPVVVQVRRGSTAAAQVDVARDVGVTGSVALQLDGVPPNVGAVFDDNPMRGAVALLQLNAGASAALGEYLLTVTGTQGGSRGTAFILLQVVDADPLADARVQRVELAQSFFARDPGLVAGKSAVLRAHVVADTAGVTAPVVRVEGFAGGASLGALDLTGPATLPLGESPGDLTQSFRADLPAAWVTSGLELAVTLDPDGVAADREERNDRVRVTPRVGSENRIDLVVVPLVLAGRQAQAGSYEAMLLAHWPLAGVSITVHAPYTVTSVADVGSDGTGWSTVLSEVRALRTSEGSSAYYYGVVPVSYTGGVAGMGYIGLPVSVGWHRTAAVLIHEIGHNFGLAHAPCGGVSSSDPEYPFANAIIGRWGYDRRNGGLIDPRSTVDLMSYCNPDWVSGYNHEKVRGRLGPLAASEGGGADVPLLMVRGRLDGTGAAVLDGVQRMMGQPTMPSRGDLELHLTFGGGRTTKFAVESAPIGCGAAPDERHFLAAVPDPGELEVLELRQAGRVLLRETTRRPDLPVGIAGERSGLGLQLVERGGALHVSWDAESWPVLSIVHVGARRTALALELRGGAVTVPLAGVPAGGAFEVAAADGIDGFTMNVVR